jgi:septin family protein
VVWWPGRQGFGDIDCGHKPVLQRIDAGFRREFIRETRIRREGGAGDMSSGSVDVVLYFFAPHRCKRADLSLLRLLRGKVSIVPILAKADSMTTDELEAFRRQVALALTEAVRCEPIAPDGIRTRTHSHTGVAGHAPWTGPWARTNMCGCLRSQGVETCHVPFAVITSSRPAGAEPHGREYPWGLAESETSSPGFLHSELGKLRRFLLIDGLLELKHASGEHYEAYRTKALRHRERGLGALLRAVFSPTQLVALSLLLPRPRRFIKRYVQTHFDAVTLPVRHFERASSAVGNAVGSISSTVLPFGSRLVGRPLQRALQRRSGALAEAEKRDEASEGRNKASEKAGKRGAEGGARGGKGGKGGEGGAADGAGSDKAAEPPPPDDPPPPPPKRSLMRRLFALVAGK